MRHSSIFFCHNIGTAYLLVLALLSLASADKCNLCGGGGGDDEDLIAATTTRSATIIPQLEIPGAPNPTCKDAIEYATTVDDDSETCLLLKSQAGFCGCPDVSPPVEPCSLCPNGNPPPNSDLTTNSGDTCEELTTYLSFLSKDECETTERGQSLLRDGFACGCEETTTDCAMCPDGTIQLSNPDSVIPFFSMLDGVGNPTCQDVAIMASSAPLDEIDCNLIQQQAGYCGCANVQPKNECNFCPDGEIPTKPELVVSTTDTCQQLHDYMTYMDTDSCSSGQATNIQALGFVCGCRGVEAQCSLCPNGEDPPQPEKVLGGGQAGTTQITCGQHAQIAAGLTEASCNDQRDSILQIIAARCGCQDTDYPVCSYQQNPNLCTEELLSTVPDVDCECYSFCDFEFAQCHDYPGGLLLGEQCLGTAVSGCNRATALRNKEEQEQKEAAENSTSPPRPSSTVLVMNSLLLFVFAFVLQGADY